MPLIASMLEDSNHQGEGQVVEHEHISMGGVVGLMRSFQRMVEALIIHLDRDEAMASIPPKGPSRILAGTSSLH
jgi:hypothetical protein